MFGLAPFAGAPFSSVLQFTSTYSPSGLQATAILGDISISSGINQNITGVSASAVLDAGASAITPLLWTAVITEQ